MTKLEEEVKQFRKGWSHEPTPIPANASGLWYSEECTDQLCIAFAADQLKAKDAEITRLTEALGEIRNRVCGLNSPQEVAIYEITAKALAALEGM